MSTKPLNENGLCSFGDEFLFTCCRHEACLKQGLMNLSDCNILISTYIGVLLEGGDVARTLIVERLQVLFKLVLTVLKAKYFTELS